MRHWGVLIWIAMFLAGQVRACQAEYRLPDGTTCVECLSAPCIATESRSHGATQVAAAKHGDCHDCCYLAHRDGGSGHQPISTSKAPQTVVFAMPCSDAETIPFDPAICAVEFVHLVGAPTTGPPLGASSRAPPL